VRYGIKELFFNVLKSNESFTVSAYLMECLNGKPKIKNNTCLSIRQLLKFGGPQLVYTKPTSYIAHSGLFCGKSYFTTLSAMRDILSKDSSERDLINTGNMKNFYE
jgi:hypothetical protein